MPTNAKSYLSNGHAYFKHTGSYNEVTVVAKNGVKNDAPSAITQKKLATKGKNSAAATTLQNVWVELGWK